MLSELHLAEEAFALHLFLQRPEGLVDIVVTDENLHVVFLSNPTVARPKAKAPGPLAHGYAQNAVDPITTLSILTRSHIRMSLYSIHPFTGTKNHGGKSGLSYAEALAKRLWRNHWIVIPRAGRP